MLSVLACLLLGIPSDQTYALKWSPKEGDSAKYQVSMTVVKDGVGTLIEMVNNHKVLNVGKDGTYTIRSTTSQTIMRSQGHEDRIDEPSVVEMVFGSDGRILRIASGKTTSTAIRVASMNRFICPDHPISVGESYTVHRSASGGGIRSSESEFSLVDFDRSTDSAQAHLKVNYKELDGEDRASAEGDWLVNPSTGEISSLNLKISGFVIGLGQVTEYHLKRV